MDATEWDSELKYLALLAKYVYTYMEYVQNTNIVWGPENLSK